MTEIQGRCHPKFARVRDAFAKEFADGNEVGASLCLTLEGETVVDLWAGFMDAARTQPWQNAIGAFVWMTLLSSGLVLVWPNLVPEGFPRWAVPLLWSNVVLNSRGVAKLLLRSWRSTEFYGLWLMATAAMLAVVLLLPCKWPLAMLAVWFAFAIILQLASVPWLIEKKPVVSPPNFFPLWIWIALAIGALRQMA